MRQFKALITFDSPETKSTYLEGFSYTIRSGNRYLNALAEVWVFQGKVAFEHQPKHEGIQGVGPGKDEIIQTLYSTTASLKNQVNQLEQDVSAVVQEKGFLLTELDVISAQGERYSKQLEFELENTQTAYADIVTLLAPEPPQPEEAHPLWEKVKRVWSRLWQ